MDMDINKRAEQYADIVSNHGLYEEHGTYDIEVAYKQGWKDAVNKACEEVEELLCRCKRLGIHGIPQQVVMFRHKLEGKV